MWSMCCSSDTQSGEVIVVKSDQGAVMFKDTVPIGQAVEDTPRMPSPGPGEPSTAAPPDARWLRGVAVDPAVVQGFFEALKADGVDLFFSQQALAPGVVFALRAEEAAVQMASDKGGAIKALGERWGFEAAPAPESAGAGASGELSVVFKTLIRTKNTAERKTITFSRKPLGMVFDKVMPIVVSEVKGHAKDLGVELGWEIEKIGEVTIETTWGFDKAYRVFTDAATKNIR